MLKSFKALIQDEVRRPLVNLMFILVGISVVIAVTLRLRPLPRRYNTDLYKELGRVVAIKTAQLIQARGQVVLWKLIYPERHGSMNDAAITSFYNTLQHVPNIHLLATEEQPVTDPMFMADETALLSQERYVSLLKKYDTVDVIVFFGVAPDCPDTKPITLPEPHPKVLVVALINPPDRNCFELNGVQSAVVPRYDAQPDLEPPATPHELFFRFYQVINFTDPKAVP